jgi:hypothetical protein
VSLHGSYTKFHGQGVGHIDLQRHPDHPRASQGQAPLRPESVEPADQPDGEALYSDGGSGGAPVGYLMTSFARSLRCALLSSQVRIPSSMGPVMQPSSYLLMKP